MRRNAVIVASIAASLCGSLAFAQGTRPQSNQPPDDERVTEPQVDQPQNTSRDPVAALVGVWEFSNADHDKICRFNFRPDTASSGHKLDIDKNCPGLFPSTKTITAWELDNYGTLHLLDANGNGVIELSEVEGGMYDGFQPDEGRYILQTAAAASVRSADETVGNWAIARGAGKPICVLTLANNAAGAGNFALGLKPGCDVMVTRFGPTSWHMDNNGELLLLSPRGQTWRFEENDANTWQRVPESADPILLVRQ